MNKILSNKYEKDTSVESLKWWIDAGKELIRYTLIDNRLSVADDSIYNNVEKSLTLFARDLLGRADLPSLAHKRASWVSGNSSSEDLKDAIAALDISIKKRRDGSGCCGAPEPSPNRKPF